MKIINKYRSHLSSEEYMYLIRSFNKNKRHPHFYGAPKVHKNKFPTPMRPVVSQCGSIFAVISIFIDYKLQSLTKHLPSYLKNSTTLLDILDTIQYDSIYHEHLKFYSLKTHFSVAYCHYRWPEHSNSGHSSCVGSHQEVCSLLLHGLEILHGLELLHGHECLHVSLLAS